MMSDAIETFARQFTYQPKIENAKRLPVYKRYILLGMGGSHLAADLALAAKPNLSLIIHSNYGLPVLPAKELTISLVIASSYSGNTEEVLDGFEQARKKKLPTVAIAMGGELIARAKKYQLPYIILPDTKIQPRSALGFGLIALMKIMNKKRELRQLKQLAKKLKPSTLRLAGKALAAQLKNSVPIIYASRRNQSIAYNWKIKFNETGKVPAFYNVFPELNHNEMTGFDVKPKSAHLSRPFHFIILKDQTDHPLIQKRMVVLERLYKKRNLPVTVMELKGEDIFEKIFTSLLIADWTALYTAGLYDLESEAVPMVEEFKRLIKKK